MYEYRIVITDSSGTELGEVTDWFDLEYSRQLNDYGKCTFTTTAESSKLNNLTALRAYQTKIYRNGTLVWAGEQAVRSGNLKAASDNIVKITSYEYAELLAHRYTDEYVRYSSTDAGAIAWGLINTAQGETNGSMGITQGTIETTQDRDRTYENKNILEAIQQLAEVNNGFDFEITPAKVFNVYSRKGVDRTATTVFEWGTNVESMSINEDFSTPVNQTIVLGENNRVVRTDTSAASIYGLRETTESAFNVTETTTMNDKGDAINQKYNTQLTTIGFKQLTNTRPFFGAISLGDTVKIRVDQGFYNINNNYRIYGYNITVDSKNKESIEYTIGII